MDTCVFFDFFHFNLKYERAGDPNYARVVKALRNAGVDLFLVGHTHTYHRSWPLLGYKKDIARNTPDTGNAVYFTNSGDSVHFPKGCGIIQVASGLGGKELRGGSFSSFDYIIKGKFN